MPKESMIKDGISIKKGFCECGCGEKTKIYDYNHKKRGWEKGKPIRFIRGHVWRVIKQVGDKHYCWKGDNVGYFALHDWIEKKLGKPNICSHCGTTSAKKYHWANISKKYKRNINDFIRLCQSCHQKFDKSWAGEKNSSAKLNNRKVKDIRFLYSNKNLTHEKISKIFNVSRATITDIINRKTWMHI